MQQKKLKGNERSARETELVLLIGATADATAKKEYYDELYTSMRPVMYKAFRRVSRETWDYDDLWQEMFLALVGAVEAYNAKPELQEKHTFFAIAVTRFTQAAIAYYRKFYKSKWKCGRPVSLNGEVKRDVQGEKTEMLDLLSDASNAEDEAVSNVHKQEIQGLDGILWAEVDKLPPRQAAAIRERFSDGRKVEGHTLSAEDMAFLHQVNKGLERLKRNSTVRNIARAYDVLQDTSMAYSGSFKSFKENMMSSVERVVLFNEEQAEREAERQAQREAREAAKRAEAEKYADRADSRQFALRDASFLVGANLTQLEKQSGVPRKTWSRWRDGGSAWFLVCKKAAEYCGRDVYEMFVDVTPKVHPRTSVCFRLTDTSFLFSAGKDAIGKQVGVSGRTIANLREGKVVTREIAKKVAAWARKPFDELFKPVGDE